MDERYFDGLKAGLDRAYTTASEARKKGFDPEDEVEVRIAQDVAARVEGIVGPPGIAKIIRQLIETGMSREDAAFEITRKIAAGEVFPAPKERLIEQAVRTGVGILTEGVLVAPTEGIAKVRIRKNPDGSDYVAVYYSGPIRSAGGTAAALSLVLADIARKVCDVGDYRATDTQVERYVEEVNTYEARVNHLQYKPPDDDIRQVARNCPVCIDGDPTEDIEVSAYRGVPGVETNRIRGGMPLVLCEGVAQKAAKLAKYTKKLNLGWDWLEKIIKIKRKADKTEIKPDDTYLEGLVAGRPVFAHPSTKGGFRLRYGRSKTNCIMGKNIHPATMVLLDGFPAYGTHLKIERPGKGCVIAGHEGLEPPVVLHENGSVLKVRTIEQANELKGHVKSVLFLGDMLITYGDFLKSNHPLLPSGWCEEWWAKELEAKGIAVPAKLGAAEAFSVSRTHGVPLHPEFTFHWHDITVEQLKTLARWLRSADPRWDGDRLAELLVPMGEGKAVLEELLVPHHMLGERVALAGDDGYSLLASLGALDGMRMDLAKAETSLDPAKDVLANVCALSGVEIKAKAPTYIGARMGRPEKAAERSMDGKPNVLFPTGSQKNRSIIKQYRTLRAVEGREKTVNLELARFRCVKCSNITFKRLCERCGGRTKTDIVCQVCGRSVETEEHCDRKTRSYDRRPVDLVAMVDSIKALLGSTPEDVRGVKGLSNATRMPERLEKGFLRAKHNVYVFRDGTARFDATDIPLTAFTPKEIGLALERLEGLGYTRDIYGNPITSPDQMVYLHCQDIVLSKRGTEYFMGVAAFLDELLVNFYGMKPFYGLKTRDDLVGHLGVGLSPHTSAGVLCRIIGFTNANVGYGHPYFHTAKRRNCFSGDETLLIHDGKGFELVTMRELVERRLKGEIQKDDFGTEYKQVSGLRVFAFDKKTKKLELAEITHVSKHIAPEKLVRLRTKSGRKITVTLDHPFPGKVGEKTRAQDVTELLAPWNLKNQHVLDKTSINLLATTKNQDIMIRTEEDVFDPETQLSGISKELGMSYKTFTNYVYRKSYPLDLVQKFNPSLISEGSYLLGGKRDKTAMCPEIAMDEDFLTLLGFYVAEGYMKKRQIDSYQVSITATKPWAKKYLEDTIKRVFGLRASMSENQATICSRLVHDLFNDLNIGHDAHTKQVPSFLYAMPEHKRNAFLRGYFSGDGSCSLCSTLEVNVTSVDKRLIDGVSYLLMFSGIRYSICEENRFVKSGPVFEFYGKPKELHSYKIRIYGNEARKYIERIGFLEDKQEHAKKLLAKWLGKEGTCRTQFDGDIFYDAVVEKKIVKATEKHTYNITVAPHHTLICSNVIASQCDGDEDSIMLLLDALLNFSRKYLNESRGGTMDAPLVLTPKIDPSEVDDEAHTIEFVTSYPLEFYHAGEKLTAPGDFKMKTVKNVLGTPEQYEGLPITHPGGSLDVGPTTTKYVQLESIPDKITTQFNLQARIKAVDAKNAAERLILSHFIPDLYGNLRSFSRQTFRCSNCNFIHRRPPLIGKCLKCGGNLLLTINKGGIEKYLEITRKIVMDYELPDYMKQRLELLEKEINSIFEDDKVKQTGLGEFL